MRVAALYDIHGNQPALEAVLDDVHRANVDLVVIGGDVFPGPMPRETLALLRALDLPVRFLRGNGDRVVSMVMRGEEPAEVPGPYRGVIEWVAAQLDADDAHFIGEWPATLREQVDEIGQVLFCHATPRNDTEIFTVLTDEAKLRPAFANTDAALVVCGHTHMQFDRTVGDTRVVNAGSVGMPFDEAGAYWLLLGPDVQLQRTNYDLEAAATRVRATEYPRRPRIRGASHPQPTGRARNGGAVQQDRTLGVSISTGHTKSEQSDRPATHTPRDGSRGRAREGPC